jgi:hypothetical protein
MHTDPDHQLLDEPASPFDHIGVAECDGIEGT